MLKVFEAFAGIGAQRMALRNIGVDFEVVGISEVDKYALNSYKAIHGDCPNYGDISKINPKDLPEMDLFTYSFPCQDITIAGKQEGIVRGKTRSGLLYECEKIIEYCRPKYLLMENVKNLIGKKNKSNFEEWLRYLESLGYTNYWQVLNAKHYGVPQNRERVFCISILGNNNSYNFPKPIELKTSVKDILEDEVEEKYYMNKPFKFVNKGHQAELEMPGHDYIKRVYSTDNVCPTLTTMAGGNTQPKFLIPQATKKSPTLMASSDEYRIRKITPKEAFRLMGLSDEDIKKIESIGISNAQQYKQAGNSIVVPVLEGIFKELLINE